MLFRRVENLDCDPCECCKDLAELCSSKNNWQSTGNPSGLLRLPMISIKKLLDPSTVH